MTGRGSFAGNRFTTEGTAMLSLLLFFSGVSAVASEQPLSYTTRAWQTEDGLPQATPRAITQTRDGFLWVGTFNGLARFDGIQFRSFTVNNTPQFKSDQINVLHEDRLGNLWVGTGEGGLVRYGGGEFTWIESSSNLSINAICEDQRGDLLVASSEGIHTVSNGQLAAKRIEGLAQKTEVIALMPTAKGDLWIGTRRAVYRAREGREVRGSHAFRDEVHHMELDQNDRPWVAFSRAGIGFAEESAAEGEKVERLSFTLLPNRFKANAMHRSPGGTLWVGSYGGPLSRLRPGVTNTFVNVATPAKLPVTAIYEANDGHIWLGLQAGGLWQLREKVVRTLGTADGLLTAVISSLCEDQDGKIWVGTFGRGLHLWDGSAQRFESVRPDLVNVTTALEDRQRNLWLGRYGGMLARRDRDGNFANESAFGMRTRVMFEDREGGLWLGTIDNGVEHFKDGVLTRYTTGDGLSHDHVRAIAQDAAGDMWFGTSRGLNRLRNGKIQTYDRTDGLGGNEVRTLFLDREGTFWIGSTGGGLTRWRDGVLRSIGTQQGLINDWIEQIVEDDEGNLWLGSNGGLMRVSLRELNECFAGTVPFVHCRFFGRSHGLLLAHCGTGFQRSAIRASDGKLWFGTSAGLIVIDPKQIKSNTNAPAVYIEELVRDDRTMLVNSAGPETRLPAGTRRLEFRYTALDFSEPAKIRFRYQLEGLDSDWVNAGTRREAIYTRPPPGEYRFRVAAKNNQGVWSEGGAAMSISIAPFFWQTRTFQVLALLAGFTASGLAGWFLLTRKHLRELRALEEKHALEGERSRIARDIHDGVGSSLVKISLLGEMAMRRMNAENQGQDQVRKMTTTARQVLRDMDEIVWAVDPKNDTLENFAGYLGHFASEHFQDTGIRCHLNLPTDLPAHSLSANTRHNLLLAVQEALNNILKHSEAKKARVSLKLVDSRLMIEIEDDGEFPKKKTHRQGNGIKNMQQRLTFIGGAASFHEGSEGGTSVRFEVPMNAHLKL
jgi:ligand-binding sensor domain-containing protein/signal transduction histidine kinase